MSAVERLQAAAEREGLSFHLVSEGLIWTTVHVGLDVGLEVELSFNFVEMLPPFRDECARHRMAAAKLLLAWVPPVHTP